MTIQSMHVLVVDDESDVELMFQHKFRKEIRSEKIGFHFALSATEALDYLESPSHRATATLILSDINMPGMNGLELLKIIKEKYAQLPVLMVTAYGDAKSKEIAESYGASGFINKPVDFTQLKKDIFESISTAPSPAVH